MAKPNLQERLSRISRPLSHLRHVLQCMKEDQRRSAIQGLAPRVQKALVRFMETFSNPQVIASTAKSSSLHSKDTPKSTALVHSGIVRGARAALCNADSTYKAHVHIKALRFYTRGQPRLEVALERQIVLVQIRQALAAASAENPFLWEDAAETCQICEAVLRANATSEEDLGLSAYIYLRAGHWLPKGCTIISPVMPLKEVLELHCRFLGARRASWQHLRGEWVQLMQSIRQPTSKRKTLREAEIIADKARAVALRVQLERAVGFVERTLSLEERRASARRKVEARRATRARIAAATAERRLARQQAEARRERRRWSRRSDLTMEDILKGPPLQRMDSAARTAT